MHGSINWGGKGKKIYPYTFNNHYGQIIPSGRRDQVYIEVSNKLQNWVSKISNGAGDDVPVIVPPTWNKTQYHGDLTKVWQRAASSLSEARNVFFCGYSLPESDYFFRYLFALGSLSKTEIKRFWVFNPDKKTELDIKK